MYLHAFLFAAVALGAGVLLLLLGQQLSDRLTTAPARRPFESGAEPQVHAWSRFHVRYFHYTLIFLLFDMEMVFMYPWAVVFMDVGWKAFMEMGMFIIILVLGILYAWREGAFQWD